jgi:hypothetical protein
MQTVIQGTKAIIYYDISGSTNISYYVEVYRSQNNSKIPLKYAVGEVGKGIFGGKNKTINIDLEKEGISQNDEIRFQIIITPELPERKALTDTSLSKMPFQVNDLRKGHTNELFWPATNWSIFVNLELHKNGKLIYPIAVNIANSGVFSWKTLKKLEAGPDYQIKIVEVNNPHNFIASNLFAIKPQVPGIVKVLIGLGGAALIAGTIYAIYYY